MASAVRKLLLFLSLDVRLGQTQTEQADPCEIQPHKDQLALSAFDLRNCTRGVVWKESDRHIFVKIKVRNNLKYFIYHEQRDYLHNTA